MITADFNAKLKPKAHAIPLAKCFSTDREDTHGPGGKNGPKEYPQKAVRRKHRNYDWASLAE